MDIRCEICGRKKFPIKKIDGYFYHVACLVLFDYAEFKEFHVSIKYGYNYEKIAYDVMENEALATCCDFCLKNSHKGMKFKCSFDDCEKYFHPICAYLNGCVFDVTRKKYGIEVKISCRKHTQPNKEDLFQQVFLRRFLCNYKNTSKLDEKQFKLIYEK